MEADNTPTPEVPVVTRDQVVDAYRTFSQNNILSPDDLSPDDPQVQAADAVLMQWASQQEARVQKMGTPEAGLLYSLDRNTIHYDAGFLDPDYLDELANDWLAQDLQSAEDAGLEDVAGKIQAKIDEINSVIA